MSKLPNKLELETSSYCNRSCTWCPNSMSDARKEQRLMPWNLFSKILLEFQQLGYAGSVSIHNYNEPLANPRIFEEILAIRESLTHSYIRLLSNGDFLDSNCLENLERVGLQYLKISLYPLSKKNKFLLKEDLRRINLWTTSKGLSHLNWQPMSEFREVSQIAQFGKLKIQVVAKRVDLFCNRGELLGCRTKKRQFYCDETVTKAVIDYLGYMKMCSNIYSELEEHNPYIIGNLKYNTFLSLWESSQMQRYRELHLESNWSASEICESCTLHDWHKVG